jgi:hypothetical protein
MARTWDLDIAGVAGQHVTRPVITLTEVSDHVVLQVEYPDLATVTVDVNDRELRLLGMWIAWYLEEGPDPQVAE